LQASIPPIPPALVCTIQTVQSSWLKKPIQGIRELEQQSFRVIRAPNRTEKPKFEQKDGLKVEPRTVVDSRITVLAENFQSSGHWQQGEVTNGQLNYMWSFEAPMGFVTRHNPSNNANTMNPSTLYVEGTLKINSQLQFELHNLSSLRHQISSNLINSLNESAKGSCVEQS
jgi:hypothetical protein